MSHPNSLPANLFLALALLPAICCGADRTPAVSAGQTPGKEVVYQNSRGSSTSPDVDRKTLECLTKAVAKALDRIRDKVEEWGVVVISEPVAVLDDTSFYVPPNIVPPDQLYSQARTDVNANSSQVNEVGFSNETTANLTPLVPNVGTNSTKTVTAKTTGTAAVPAATPAPAPAPATPVPMPAPPQLLTDLTAQFGDFSAPFALLQHTQPVTKSVTESLREAQDNTVRQKIYTQMSFPKSIPNYTSVLFVIVQISCNPGWRTQEHYIGDCSASVEYFDPRRSAPLSLKERRMPTVFSVLPLMDAQTVEMANSQRQITQLAFQLAASLPAHGVKVDVNNLLKFVHRYAKDMRSVSPIPVVNSYSSGGTFGFRFSPSFQAQRDPAQKNSRAANVLLPTTFPALITVVVHEADIDYLTQNKGFDKNNLRLIAHTSTRWYLKDRLPLWQFPKRLFTPMRRDTDQMEIDTAAAVRKIFDLRGEINGIKAQLGLANEFDPQDEEARRQIVALSAKGIGRDWPIPLPAQVQVDFPTKKSTSPVTNFPSFFDPDIVTEQMARNLALQARADAARTGEKPTISSITPLTVSTSPTPSAQAFTITGTGLDAVSAATLADPSGKPSFDGKVTPPSNGTVKAVFDLSSLTTDGQQLVMTLFDANKLMVAKAAGGNIITISVPPPPKITGIVPSKPPLQTDVMLRIQGTGLDNVKKAILSDPATGNVQKTGTNVSFTSGEVKATFDLSSFADKTELTVTVQDKDGKQIATTDKSTNITTQK